jgi:hypothetical protein
MAMKHGKSSLMRAMVVAIMLFGLGACASDPSPQHFAAYRVGGSGK